MFSTKEKVIEFLRETKFWQRHFDTRKIDIFFSDGYDVPTNRTVFFSVTGSPNKFTGQIFVNARIGTQVEVRLQSNLGTCKKMLKIGRSERFGLGAQREHSPKATANAPAQD